MFFVRIWNANEVFTLARFARKSEILFSTATPSKQRVGVISVYKKRKDKLRPIAVKERPPPEVLREEGSTGKHWEALGGEEEGMPPLKKKNFSRKRTEIPISRVPSSRFHFLYSHPHFLKSIFITYRLNGKFQEGIRKSTRKMITCRTSSTPTSILLLGVIIQAQSHHFEVQKNHGTKEKALCN